MAFISCSERLLVAVFSFPILLIDFPSADPSLYEPIDAPTNKHPLTIGGADFNDIFLNNSFVSQKSLKALTCFFKNGLFLYNPSFVIFKRRHS